MQVKTAELKNNLSKYLHRVREKKETIIVCDRDTPVATLSPIVSDEDADWERHKAEMHALAQRTGMPIRVPEKRPVIPKLGPILAPDGRTDINTVVEMREEKDW